MVGPSLKTPNLARDSLPTGQTRGRYVFGRSWIVVAGFFTVAVAENVTVKADRWRGCADAVKLAAAMVRIAIRVFMFKQVNG